MTVSKRSKVCKPVFGTHTNKALLRLSQKDLIPRRNEYLDQSLETSNHMDTKGRKRKLRVIAAKNSFIARTYVLK